MDCGFKLYYKVHSSQQRARDKIPMRQMLCNWMMVVVVLVVVVVVGCVCVGGGFYLGDFYKVSHPKDS